MPVKQLVSFLHVVFFPFVLLNTLSGKAQAVEPSFSAIQAYNKQFQAPPMLFTENCGQITDHLGKLRPDILFISHSKNATMFLTATGIHYQFEKTFYVKDNKRNKQLIADSKMQLDLPKTDKTETTRFTLSLIGANTASRVRKEQKSSYTENFYLPHCPNGITGVHTYGRIVMENVYPGIDWAIYSADNGIKYDFIVHPGADPAVIQLHVQDAEHVSINQQGQLLMSTILGEVKEAAPVSFCGETAVKTSFKQADDGTIHFAIAAWDRSKVLTIDPSVTWATYYGGNSTDNGFSCATDSLGNVYLAGKTESYNMSSGGFQNNYFGGDAFLVKFNSSGARLWATYYGGNGEDIILNSCIDGSGNVLVVGQTTSSNNIASTSSSQSTFGGQVDGFLAKFSTNGTRLWGTYFGGLGSDYARACSTDTAGNIYIAGTTNSSTGIASGGFQNNLNASIDAFLAKFSTTGVRVWSTYYGGSAEESGYGCATDRAGNVYLTGSTKSTTNIAFGGFQNTLAGYQNAFLVKFNGSGTRLWATYYGTATDEAGSSCVTDTSGNVYMTGYTSSQTGLGTVGLQNISNGDTDIFLVKFSSSGARLWGSYYGGNDWEYVRSAAIDPSGYVYIMGTTTSRTGLASGGFQNIITGVCQDAFAAKFNSNGSRIWSTYYGGPDCEECFGGAVDGSGNVYLAGYSLSSTNIASGGFQNVKSIGPDAYLAKINSNSTLRAVCPSGSFSLTSNYTGINYQWQVDTGTGYINILNTGSYLGATTRTLQVSTPPSGFYGYQYRCLVDGNANETFELRFVNTWTGAVSNVWEVPGNWSCNVVPDGNVDVIINSGAVRLSSNKSCRSIKVQPGVLFTVVSGFTLAILH